MPNIEETVHIIPLGHEIDRAVKPFESLKADRVYLLTNLEIERSDDEMFKNQKICLEKVEKILQRKKIEVTKILDVNLFDLLDVMKTVSQIIVKETALHNRVFVNMSAAGRLTSVAATLAGMAHKANVYYVHADEYPTNKSSRRKHGLSICNLKKSDILENFEIKMPEEIGMKILLLLSKGGKPKKMRDILGFLKEENVPGFQELFDEVEESRMRSLQSNQLMKLDKTVLTKLEKHGYISRKKDGRNVFISITKSGNYIAHISGLLD
ncbi:MAG: DUF6293 family protein [Methanoregula sp.]|nr:DUF6293 family protein [Methanoregula sp.]